MPRLSDVVKLFLTLAGIFLLIIAIPFLDEMGSRKMREVSANLEVGVPIEDEGRLIDQSATDYIESIREDIITVYPNTATESKDDFFIMTEADETFIIKVSDENGTYTHTEKQVTEDTKELSAMKEASIQTIVR